MSLHLPTFSIIVPIYNSEHCLFQCIQSILNQTFHDFELLLINDGSQDDSAMVCDKLAEDDSRIRVFHKPNGGVSSARNVGLDNARGQWIVFCDSDDWVLPEWLNDFAQNFSGVDLVCQGIRFDRSCLSGSNGIKDFVFEYEGTVSQLLDRLFVLGIVGYTMTKCFRTSFISEYNIRFDHRFNFREDEEFVLKYLTYCSKVRAINKVGYHYIVPDFSSKYRTENNMYDLCRSLYNSLSQIYTTSSSDYLIKVRNDFTNRFIILFASKDFVLRRNLLLQYRTQLGKDVFLSNMFFLTKFLIFVDITGIVSTAIFSINLVLRNYIDRKRR